MAVAEPSTFGARRRDLRVVSALAGGACLAVAGAAVVGRAFEPSLLLAVAAVAMTWLLLGRRSIVVRLAADVLALIAAALGVAMATGGTAADVRRGLVDGPRQILTTEWPSPRWPTVLVAIAAAVVIVTAIAVELAASRRWRAAPVVPLVLGFAALVAVGAGDGVQWASLAGLCAVAFAMLLTSADHRTVAAGSTVALLGVAGLVAVGVGVATTSVARADPRTARPPANDIVLGDPLVEVAAQRALAKPVDLYRVHATGAAALRFWRVAVLDSYDGSTWSAAGHLRPIGTRLAKASTTAGVAVDLTILRSDSQFVPLPGTVLTADAAVETDDAHDVVRTTSTARPLDVPMTIEPFEQRGTLTTGVPEPWQASEIETSLLTLSKAAAGLGDNLVDQVNSIAATLRSGYVLDNGTAGGLQLVLLNRFLRDTKRGTSEQFVAGFVLMARSIGVEARVATGYELDPPALAAGTITTANAAAWPEVNLKGVGWVAVDVQPAPTQTSDTALASPQRPPTPPAAQSPNQERPVTAPVDPGTERVIRSASAASWSAVRFWATRGGVGLAVLLGPALAIGGVITLVKRRRRRGLRSADPVVRISTAWLLATDDLVDAGAHLLPGHTNADLVMVGSMSQPTVEEPLTRVRASVDRALFSAREVPTDIADSAVEALREIERGIASSSTRWWRWRWRLSTRSLRHSTRSPLRQR